MSQKYIEVQKVKSGQARNAREVAPVAAIEEQLYKHERELMDPEVLGSGKVVEIVENIDKLKGQLEAYAKEIKGGGAKNYLNDVKKYGDSLIYSIALPGLQILYNKLITQISSENIGNQKKLIEAIGGIIKKYTRK